MDVDGLRRYQGQSPAMKLAATTKTTMTMIPTMNHAQNFFLVAAFINVRLENKYN